MSKCWRCQAEEACTGFLVVAGLIGVGTLGLLIAAPFLRYLFKWFQWWGF